MESVLHREILEQPAVLERLLRAESGHISELGARLAAYGPRYLLIAARGTSDNAARYAQYLFGVRNRLPVALAAPSLFTLYHRPPRLEGGLVIGISQSGQSPDIVAVIEQAERDGVPSVAITNEPHSPLANAAREVIALSAGPERSIAATKTYTAELAALALLSLGLAPDKNDREALWKVPEALSRALGNEAQTLRAAALLVPHDRSVVIGRGFNYCTAFELALKIKELTYLVAEPYSAADFEHGPLALVEPGFPVILIAVGGPTRNELLQLGTRVRERGAALIWLGEDGVEGEVSDSLLSVPSGIPEWTSPLVAIGPGQLLACQLALARGLDPDAPRAIHKVTLTK